MICLDTSVLVVESLIPDAGDHDACGNLIQRPDVCVYTHALSETFATLTGGALGFRVDASIAADLVKDSIVAFTTVVALDAADLLDAQTVARTRGIRG